MKPSMHLDPSFIIWFRKRKASIIALVVLETKLRWSNNIMFVKKPIYVFSNNLINKLVNVMGWLYWDRFLS